MRWKLSSEDLCPRPYGQPSSEAARRWAEQAILRRGRQGRSLAILGRALVKGQRWWWGAAYQKENSPSVLPNSTPKLLSLEAYRVLKSIDRRGGIFFLYLIILFYSKD